ncbi:MAG: glutamyl-tRNA reductase [Desulfohalobiaceae bacterium]
MQPRIYLLGLNHRTAPIEIREKYSLQDLKGWDLDPGRNSDWLREIMLLSTCNRVEILAVADPGLDAKEALLQAWANACRGGQEELREQVYAYTDQEAVAHVFQVAASLDSMIIGEPQILGQLKEAYRQAVDQGSTRVILNRLLHKAFSVAKRIRSETRVAQHAVSVSYAAVELAKNIFEDLARQKALLIGAGEMSELAAQHLLNAGVPSLQVTNRTFSRAQELAKRFKAEPFPFSELGQRLSEVDIVLTSTGANKPIIRAKDMQAVLKKRRNRPMFFIDIAVPREVDPDLNQLDNVYLYDIDDLKDVVEENLALRGQEADLAQEIIQEEVDKFRQWQRSLGLTATIVDLLQQGQDVAEREVHKTLKNLGPEVNPEVTQAIQTMAESICKKLYHNPIVFLKRRAQEEDSARELISLTRRMFNLDQEEVPKDAHAFRKKGRGGS